MTEENNKEVYEIRVSGSTASKELAGSLLRFVRAGRRVALIAIGHSAVGQAIKAIPVLNSITARNGKMYGILPTFEDRMPTLSVKQQQQEPPPQSQQEVKATTVMILHVVELSVVG